MQRNWKFFWFVLCRKKRFGRKLKSLVNAYLAKPQHMDMDVDMQRNGQQTEFTET